MGKLSWGTCFIAGPPKAVFLAFLFAVSVKTGVAGVEVFGVEVILSYSHSVGKSLEVDYLALTQEFDGVVDVGVV